MTLYDNEENAIVNNADKEGETPSNLVGDVQDFDPEGLNSEDKFDDKLWPKVVLQGEVWWDGDVISFKEIGRINGELTPNPAKFGFRKQEIVDSLPGSGLPDHLYLLKVKNDGVLIGYRPYKWALVEGVWGWHRANLVTPDLDLKKGEHDTPVEVVNAPKKKPAQVFNGDVAIFDGELYINGKTVQKLIDDATSQLQSGTKLYRHILTFVASDDTSWNINVITNKSNAYDLTNEIEATHIISFGSSNDNNGNSIIILDFSYLGSTKKLSYNAYSLDSEEFVFVDETFVNMEDDVTPL